MNVLNVCVAGLESIEHGERTVETGIFKKPVAGGHHVTITGFEGDRQADLKHHGGPDKAVYVYSIDNYRYWERELGRDLPPGQFGENLTVAGMPDEAVHIGDIFRVGSSIVQVTQPRVPCFKLGIKMGDPDFVRRFHYSGRVGFYLRVLREGDIQAGDAIEAVEADAGRLDIRDAMLALNDNPRQRDIIARALAIPALSAAWREDLQKKQRRFGEA